MKSSFRSNERTTSQKSPARTAAPANDLCNRVRVLTQHHFLEYATRVDHRPEIFHGELPLSGAEWAKRRVCGAQQSSDDVSEWYKKTEICSEAHASALITIASYSDCGLRNAGPAPSAQCGNDNIVIFAGAFLRSSEIKSIQL